MKDSFDWSRFTIKTPIPANPEKVFKAWTSQENLEKWFLRLAEFTASDGTRRRKEANIQVGDTYKWFWHGYPDSVVEHGKIKENNEKDFLKFTFGEAGVVSVKVYPHEQGSMVELTQEDIPHFDTTEISYHVECKSGWTFYLANLKSILQGGLDLRNRDMSLNLD